MLATVEGNECLSLIEGKESSEQMSGRGDIDAERGSWAACGFAMQRGILSNYNIAYDSYCIRYSKLNNINYRYSARYLFAILRRSFRPVRE